MRICIIFTLISISTNWIWDWVKGSFIGERRKRFGVCVASPSTKSDIHDLSYFDLMTLNLERKYALGLFLLSPSQFIQVCGCVQHHWALNHDIHDLFYFDLIPLHVERKYAFVLLLVSPSQFLPIKNEIG